MIYQKIPRDSERLTYYMESIEKGLSSFSAIT